MPCVYPFCRFISVNPFSHFRHSLCHLSPVCQLPISSSSSRFISATPALLLILSFSFRRFCRLREQVRYVIIMQSTARHNYIHPRSYQQFTEQATELHKQNIHSHGRPTMIRWLSVAIEAGQCVVNIIDDNVILKCITVRDIETKKNQHCIN